MRDLNYLAAGLTITSSASYDFQTRTVEVFDHAGEDQLRWRCHPSTVMDIERAIFGMLLGASMGAAAGSKPLDSQANLPERMKLRSVDPRNLILQTIRSPDDRPSALSKLRSRV